jgi:hypothetical protein
MKALSKKLVLPNKDYYIVHLSIINALIPSNKLTPKEIEVLASFMMLQGDIAEDRFGSTAKKKIRSELNLSDAGLSNYIKSLKAKGFVTNSNTILQMLIPNDVSQDYYLQVINKDYGTTEKSAD